MVLESNISYRSNFEMLIVSSWGQAPKPPASLRSKVGFGYIFLIVLYALFSSAARPGFGGLAPLKKQVDEAEECPVGPRCQERSQ